MKANWLGAGDELGAPISPETLADNGVLYERLSTVPAEYQPDLDRVKRDNGYGTQDEVALRPDNPKLDEICAKFIGEHLHDEDEVRFVLDGEGVFDIRSSDDRWMRVHVERGDLIVVPAKRYHRFFLTDTRTIHCVRLFQDPAGWVPHYRAA